jgi:DNA modification methylase
MTWNGVHGIVNGDVLATLREIPSNHFDALLCDPPYGFRFMNKAWDYDVPSVDVWREALRVLKPGASLVSFGGSRTFHRIATAIEDAGFELRDCLMWLYGKGFPKSLNIGKALAAAALKAQADGDDVRALAFNRYAAQFAGQGTALKPAWEPIILARKPTEGTMAENVYTHFVGGLAIDACRIEADGRPPIRKTGETWGGSSFDSAGSQHAGTTDDGRWPANLILDEAAGALLDSSVDPTTSVPFRENVADGAVLPLARRTAGGYSDSGGPSRFFYCSKVSTKEREFGCELLPAKSAGEMTERVDGQAGLDNPRAGAGRTGGARNHHPTLKPLSLARWLARLIMPPTPDAQLLIPYSGAGSEMIGALQAGWPVVFGIEGEADYVQIAEARIAAWGREP